MSSLEPLSFYVGQSQVTSLRVITIGFNFFSGFVGAFAGAWVFLDYIHNGMTEYFRRRRDDPEFWELCREELMHDREERRGTQRCGKERKAARRQEKNRHGALKSAGNLRPRIATYLRRLLGFMFGSSGAVLLFECAIQVPYVIRQQGKHGA